MSDLVKQVQAEAYDKLKKLHGLPPHGRNNPCYADGHFAKSLERDYNMSIVELENWVGFIKDPNGLVIQNLKQWLARFDPKDNPERTTHVSKGTLEDMVRLLETGTTKK